MSRPIALLVAVLCFSACSRAPRAVEPTTDASRTDHEVSDMSVRDVLEQLDGNTRHDTGAPSGGVHPRWVLRDKNGNPLNVLAMPTFVQATPVQLPEEFKLPPASPLPCFAASWLDDSRWSGVYDLATGTMSANCLQQFTASYFLDAGCTKAAQPWTLQIPSITMLDGVPVFTKTRQSPAAQLYTQDDSGTCSASITAGDVPGVAFYSLEPVPAGYVDAFADGAPYTLNVEF